MCRPSVVTWFSLLSLLCVLPATRGVAQDASPSVELTAEAPAAPPGIEPVSGDVTPSTRSEVSSEVPSPTGSVTTELAAPHEPTVVVAEIAETVPEVVVDPTPPVAVAWGRGLTFHSDDDRFSLQIRGRLQAQAFVESGVSDADPASVDFLVRRARLVFRGHLLDANLEYYVQLGLAPRDMEPDLLIPVRDAQIAWTGLRDMNVRVGVMKVPFSRERVISSSSLQLVDRSIVNAELAVDRDNGVQLYSNDLFGLGGYLGYQLGVFGGDGRLRVNNDLGLLYVARVQVQPFGRFDDSYIESDLTREERLRLSIGVGFAYNEDTNRRRRTTTDFYQLARFSYFHGEADLILKYAGFSLQAELLLRQVDGAASATNLDAQGMEIVETSGSALGWFAQAGYLFDFAPVEIAARVADIYPQGPSAVHASREVTVGFSWYPMGHDLKLQLDGSYLSTARESTGVTSLTERFQGRVQVQAYF
ncbi:MAG: hypothetical protein J0L92_03340 [Deltaproteobacteria bacterium]|nr:hypothetical protein [Deltaproteobacteria bacterium]